MDQGLKERLIGAAVLVALAVWLIPWLLDGPDEAADSRGSTLQLPVPGGKAADVKTEVIDLAATQAPPSPAVEGAGAGLPARDAGGVSTARPASPPPTAARSGAEKATSGATPSAATRSAAAGSATGGATHGTRDGEADAAPARDSVASTPPRSAPPASTGASTAAASASPTGPAASAARSEARPEPAVAVDGDWAVQLGSFGEEENARRLAERVAVYGARAHISNYRADGRTMYRVRIGPYSTRAGAEAEASALGAHDFVAQVVTAQ